MVNGKQLSLRRFVCSCFVYQLVFRNKSCRTWKKVVFGKDSARIMENGKVFCTADPKGRLYELNVDVMKVSSAMFGDSESQLSLWHRRFGHIGKSGLMKLIRNDMIEGIECAIY